MEIDNKNIENSSNSTGRKDEAKYPAFVPVFKKFINSVEIDFEWINKTTTSAFHWREKAKSLSIAAGIIAGDKIDEVWITEQFKQADFILAAYMKQPKYQVRSCVKTIRCPIAMSALHVVNNTNNKGRFLQSDDVILYIDVLCSNFLGLGKELLSIIESYAKQHLFNKLQLGSLANVINYYRKFGFIFTHTREECKTISRLYQRNDNALGLLKFDTDDECQQNRQFCHLLCLLKDNGFSTDLGASANLHDSLINGFVMTKIIV